MAFVNEDIPEEDKEWFNSFGFTSPYTDKTVEPWKWTIDRERNIFLCVLAGLGSKSSGKVRFFVLVINGIVVIIEAYTESHGNKWNGRDVIWEVEKIIVPNKLGTDAQTIMDLVVEVLTVHGYLYDIDTVNKVEFQKMPPPIFEGRL